MLKLSRERGEGTFLFLFCFVSGIKSRWRTVDSYGDIEDRVKTIELQIVTLHRGILEIKKKEFMVILLLWVCRKGE